MGFNSRIFHEPAILTALSISMAVAGCALYMCGHRWWGSGVFLTAVWCGSTLIRETRRIRSNISYLIAAAMNGDFSYKFPENKVAEDERDINRMLNHIVEHLETLSERAREEETFLRLVINLVDIGIIVANERGHVIHSNLAALQLLSIPVLTDIRQIPKERSNLEIKKITAKLRGEPIAVYTVADVSRMVQAAELESLEKLTRVLTHEIMNSLTPVSSISETLGKRLKEDPDATYDPDFRIQMDVIRSSSNSLMEFVRNFRKFSVVPEPKPQILYLRPFLERQVSLAKALEGAEGVQIKLSVFPPDMMAYTDGNLMGQVIVNILKNAVEAAPSLIEVKATVRDDESVEISVSNDGEPIPESIYSQIFTPFFTTKQNGNGIGLSLSRRIVATLGGTLTLYTRPQTRFTIILP